MFKKNKKGEIYASKDSEVKEYHKLKKINQKILNLSDNFWNWPSATTLTRPSLARILHLNDLYKQNLNNCGHIIEFGVQYGTSSLMLYNLREIYEPNNYNRKIISFDTFEGFKNISSYDSNNSKIGDYNTCKDYEKTLNEIFESNQKLNSKTNIKKHSIIKGDASVTFKNWSKNNKGIIISLAILDMDIFKPTFEVLKILKKHLTKGSIIAFDEINHEKFPGETIALMKSFKLEEINLIQSKFLTHAAWFKI